MKHFMVLAALVAAPAFAAEQAAQPAPQSVAPPAPPPLAATVCKDCHGLDGNSLTPTFPKLAGQPAEYIAKQLMDMKAGGPRVAPLMMGFSALFATPADAKAIGDYFAAQKPNAGATSQDKEKLAMGEKLWKGGNLASGVAACTACHGVSGAGLPAQYPRLAGQHKDYLVGELKKFRSGDRKNDPNKMMRDIAGKMTDKEIDAVAEYIAGK